jgi:tRNA(Ile)-lysidine synthase TilS/MesJ
MNTLGLKETNFSFLFQKILLNRLRKTTTYLLAVSGGSDSMFLLDVFYKCQFSFVVCHLSEGQNNQETQIVKDYCTSKKIMLEIKEITREEALEVKRKKQNLQS